MAEKSGRNKSIEELTAEITQSRERVARDLRGLQYGFLAFSGSCCWRGDRTGADAKEKNLRRRKRRP